MRYYVPSAYMLFETIPDVDERNSINGVHFYVDANRLSDGKSVENLLWHGGRISLRAVANNMDGDDRSGINPEDRHCFGEIVRCATISAALDFFDNPEEFPPMYKDVLRHDPEELSLLDDLETSLDALIETSSTQLMAYLFGRNYSPDSTEPEMESMWVLTNDVLWELVSAIKEAIPNIIELFDIMVTMEGWVSGWWDVNNIHLYLYSDKPDKDLDKFNFRGNNNGSSSRERHTFKPRHRCGLR